MELTRTEFSLLELFLRNPRQVLTRSLIFERVWGYDFGPTSNSLEVYVGYLRRKTEAGGRAAAHPHGSRRSATPCASHDAPRPSDAFGRARRRRRGRARIRSPCTSSSGASCVARSTSRYAHARRRSRDRLSARLPTRAGRCSAGGGYFQIVAADGRTFRRRGATLALPVDERTTGRGRRARSFLATPPSPARTCGSPSSLSAAGPPFRSHAR